MKTYHETVEWMFQQLPMYQRVGKQAFKKDLTNTLKLAEQLAHPEKKFKSIHVAGTNGKGSVSHMLAAVFQSAGYKTGLYTSPHLKDFRERIRVNGQMIGEEEVVEFIDENKAFLEENSLSFFEMSVGMAFDHFARQQVDIAIIEVGMGGRLDSTNIINPELSVITNIGLDHTAFLGEDLATIAGEKAGIIKEQVPVVIGEKQQETQPVFQKKATEMQARIFFAEDYQFPVVESDLKGAYQKKNLRTLMTAIKVLAERGWKLSEAEVKNGLSKVKLLTGLQGRWDVLQLKPKVICDTAHNAEGLKIVLKQLKKEKFQHLHILIGVVNDKDLSKVLDLFPKEATYYFAKPNVPRGLEAQLLQQEAVKYGLEGKVFDSVKDAYDTALDAALDEDLIFIGGSNFTVAEVL
ncbi:bifunctional folylpolyglutamate synthase/dihydrofolate synthase [Gramella sp. GC03-9]|uniref:Dihydrofolate synthase/folylpolyglutamate synthase n=1 Tax=Christiangramia oceanisediminis TaxID=2920386 RepID=A0A9X2L0A7_9FLAO|nr:folylpolyglutamate synthase/dihydrofolate synthase family protein [Gramella oceanisediminis]MCP9201602.1 bifunctional folylpolyglutamate synthase/dihydrofolate synthase [Gramella oceanisediminis]